MNRLRLSYRWLAALLALLLCLSSFACQMPAGQPEATPSATSPSATDAVQATPEPTATPEPQENASQLLAELDHDIFVSYAAGDGHSLAVLLRDPAAFGIDVSEVPETWGEFTEEDSHATVSTFVEYLERLQHKDGYGGMQDEKYKVWKYNRDNSPTPEAKARLNMIGVICACLMLAATAVYVGAVTVTRFAPAAITSATSLDGFISRPMARCHV